METAVAVSGETTGILGVIAWFSIGDMRVPREVLEETFKKYEVPGKYLPKEIREADAFRKATKSIEGHAIRDGKKITILVRDLICTDTLTVRKIVEETRDIESQKLLYDSEIGTMTFNKKSKSLEVGIKNPIYVYLEEAIVKAFEEYSKFYDGNRIRTIVRAYLSDMRPLLMRPNGSVYFVPSEYQQNVERLKDAVNDFAKYSVSEWDTLFLATPFIDIEKNRELLTLRWDLYIRNKALSIVDDIGTLMTDGKFTESASNNVREHLRYLNDATKKYEELLSRQLNETKDVLTKLSGCLVASEFAKVAENLRTLLHPQMEGVLP